MDDSVLVNWYWFYDDSIGIYFHHSFYLFCLAIGRLVFLHLHNHCVIPIILLNMPNICLNTKLCPLRVQKSVRLPKCNFIPLFQLIDISNHNIIIFIFFEYFGMSFLADYLP